MGMAFLRPFLCATSRPLWLDDHLARLVSGAKQLNIPCDIAELKRDCARLLADFSKPVAALRNRNYSRREYAGLHSSRGTFRAHC